MAGHPRENCDTKLSDDCPQGNRKRSVRPPPRGTRLSLATSVRPRLRNALRKLRTIPLTGAHPGCVATAPQEMLDFLAMLAGLKPVYLLGRGLDDPRWVGCVLKIAREMDLRTVQARYWDALSCDQGLASSYREKDNVAARDAFYITSRRAVAQQVVRIRDTGKITLEEESRLLGYPICCVEEHYRRDLAMKQGYALMLRRIGRGDEAEMHRLVAEDAPLSPETDDERRLIGFATTVRCAPFTSVNMCESCATGENTPAIRLGRTYRRLAMALDPLLTAEISAISLWVNTRVACSRRARYCCTLALTLAIAPRHWLPPM